MPVTESTPHLVLTRDPKGRIIERRLSLGDFRETRCYAYDSAGRLSRVTDGRGGLVESYQYDHLARRLAEINPLRSRGERRYAYGPGDRLAAAGTAQYGHDRAGFRNLKVVGDAETRYHYEPSGLLLHVDLPDGRRIQYVHDSSGLRVEKRVNGRMAETYRWHDPLRLAEFFDGRQWWALAYLPEDGPGRPPVGLTNGEASYLLLADQLGTPLGLATPDGTIVQLMRYDSFGNLLEQRGDVVRLPLGFAGGLFDRDTGLTRFVWRDYDADTGRFTALDPLREKGGDTDFYGYCVDDPVNRVDVWGLEYIGLDMPSQWSMGETSTESPTLLGADRGESDLTAGQDIFEPSTQLGWGSGGPTWGNWGGLNHSGGVDPKDNGGQDGTAPPVDSSDEAYMRHDKGKGRCDNEDILANDPAKWRRVCNREADKQLVKELRQLPENPKDWPRPPKPGLEKDANRYKKGAIWLFE